MEYTGYKTFNAINNSGMLTVIFNFPPINVLGNPMLNDIDKLCEELENDKGIKVVVFESANPEIFIAHADTDFQNSLENHRNFETLLMNLQNIK